MRGISKATLEKLRDSFMYKYGLGSVPILDDLIYDQCKELNPWLPIDENTPKDRELLLLYSDKTKVVGVWHKDKGFDMYDDWLCKTITATHYQELPDDPEDFIC